VGTRLALTAVSLLPAGCGTFLATGSGEADVVVTVEDVRTEHGVSG